MDVLLLIFQRNLLSLMVQVNLLGFMNRRSNVVTPVGCHFVLDAISPRCRRSVVSDADSKSTARATGDRGLLIDAGHWRPGALCSLHPRKE